MLPTTLLHSLQPSLLFIYVTRHGECQVQDTPRANHYSLQNSKFQTWGEHPNIQEHNIHETNSRFQNSFADAFNVKDTHSDITAIQVHLLC